MGLDERKPVFWFVNKKRRDQPAHLRRLIRAFVIRFLESVISKLATRETEETGLSLPLSETCHSKAHIISIYGFPAMNRLSKQGGKTCITGQIFSLDNINYKSVQIRNLSTLARDRILHPPNI